MLNVLCPTCGNLIRIKTEPGIGQYISCPECQDVFNLASINPPVLEPIKIGWDAPVNKNGRRDKHQKPRERYQPYDEFEDDFDGTSYGKRSKKNKKRENRNFD